jgi:hypothetical protein
VRRDCARWHCGSRPTARRLLNGFVRNSAAPAFIPCTVMGTSPWPVMKMMGMSVRSASRFCRSRPLSPGSVTSSTRQQGTAGWGRHRNSCADANVSARHPAVRTNSSSDSRTETSSSTTKTIDVTSSLRRTSMERETVGEGTVMAPVQRPMCSSLPWLPHS